MFAALAQLTYGLLLFMRPWAYAEDGDSRRRPEAIARPIYQAGAAGNLAIIGLYLITRTAGIPLFGPGAGRVEPLTALSLAVTVTEAVLAWILLGLARREESGMTQAAAGARPDSRQEI